MPAIFNKEQEEAITHKEGPLMVLAGPGSGKTLVITYRVKWLIENAGVHPSNILVITFTRAAAEEMRKRFFAWDGECTGNIWYFSLNFLYDSSLCIPIYGRKYYP